MLAARQDNAAQRDHAFAAHRLTDHYESVHPHTAVRNNVVGRVEVSLIDRGARHKAVNVNRARAFNLDFLKLLVLNQQELIAADFITAALVLAVDDLTGFRVDELLLEAVAGPLVDLAERNALRA